MRFFLALLLILPSITFADSIRIGFIIPEFNQDGTALAPTDIDGYKVKHWLNNTKQPDIDIIGGLTNEHVIADVLPGYHVFQVAATVDGEQGDYTDPFVLPISIIPPPLPAAPSMSVQLVCDPNGCNIEVK